MQVGVTVPGRENDILEFTWEGPEYEDREEAGRVLAERLKPHAEADPVVLAIPNGGVAVGIPVAKALGCSLRLLVVRKMKIPHNPEAGFGSVASDGTVLLNEPLVHRLGLREEVIARQREEALRSIRERLDLYGAVARFPDLERRTAIVVDDGLASGLTMEAAVRVVRRHDPGSVIVAVPTASMSARRRLLPQVDHLICPHVSRLPVFAVANAYRQWRDMEDDEVIALLHGME